MYKSHYILLSLTLGAAATACAQTAVPDSSQPISQQEFINAAESTVNGVVSVKSYATPRQQNYGYNGNGFDPFDDPMFRFFFGEPQQTPRREQQSEPVQVGLGSGVIISTDGLIVTNNHVIDGAERLEITLNDNRNYTATIVGSDPVSDLALIKIDAPDLHVIPMGNSEDLHVGEWVLAVGNPFGFTSTVTSGIVSAKARNITTMTQSRPSGGIEAYIQTDAAVNRGNSGGALVNLRGELVGINTAIYSQTGTYAGCSFAIPTSIVQKVVSDLKEFGTVQRAFLGISFMELTPELISKEQIQGATRGIYVAEVQDRTAAREAGIEPGDIITHIDGIEVTGTARLQEIMARRSPGDRITISYVRNGKQAQVDVTLRNRDGKTSVTVPDTPMSVLGATFEAAPEDILKKLELSRGVQVTITGNGRFKNAGISNGFVITSINNQKVNDGGDIEKLFNAIRALGAGSDKVMFISGYYPSGKQAYYAVDLGD